jgi:hypothetical protein
MSDKDDISNGEHAKEDVKERSVTGTSRYVEETDDVLLDMGTAKLEDGTLGGLKLAKDGHVRICLINVKTISSI